MARQDSHAPAEEPWPVTIRLAVQQDAAAVAGIYNHYVDLGGVTLDQQHWQPQRVELWLERLGKRELVLVAQGDSQTHGAIHGWAAIKQYSDRAGYQVCCEESVFVAPAATGRGVGQKLMDELVARCRHLGYHHLVAKICADNRGSIQFHTRNGFEIVGTQREIGFQNNRWTNVTILQRILDDVPMPVSQSDRG